MAKMIPPALADRDSSQISSAERLVFDLLKQGPYTGEWVVLHSVKVPGKGRNSNPREVDFLILVPGRGVICLEVKGERSYKVKNGQWFRESQPDVPEPESPEKQAEIAMDALIGHLRSAARGPEKRFEQSIRRLPIWYATAFTHASWPENAPTVPGSLVFEAPVTLDQEKLCSQLRDFAHGLPDRGRSKYPLTAETMDFIVRTLRPDSVARFVLTSGPEVTRIDRRLLELTREQYAALGDVLDESGNVRNERILIEGGAGTGKTMLAMELARRRHQLGDRVAIICHRELLGDWLRRELPNIPGVGSPTQTLFDSAQTDDRFRRQYNRDVALAGSIPFNRAEVAQQYLWKAASLLIDKGLEWDYLIVDELQYFSVKDRLEVLDLCLKGGLASGRWTMFGDFKFQNWLLESDRRLAKIQGLPADEFVDSREYLGQLSPGTNAGKGWMEPRPLAINCRNTMPIAKAAARVVAQEEVNVQPSKIAGPDVAYYYFDDGSSLVSLLSEELDRLQRAGVAPQHVAIVSHMDGEQWHERTFGLWKLWTYNIRRGQWPDSENGKWVGSYRAIEFAGMESDIVILIDGASPDELDNTGDNRNIQVSTLYVSMTRAKAALIVLAHESKKDMLEPTTVGRRIAKTA